MQSSGLIVTLIVLPVCLTTLQNTTHDRSYILVSLCFLASAQIYKFHLTLICLRTGLRNKDVCERTSFGVRTYLFLNGCLMHVSFLSSFQGLRTMTQAWWCWGYWLRIQLRITFELKKIEFKAWIQGCELRKVYKMLEMLIWFWSLGQKLCSSFGVFCYLKP